MFQSVTVTNFMGDSLELPLKWPNDAGLLISNIDGITPGNVQINSQDYATLDGGVYNSSRMQTRNITIEMYYGFSPHIESARHRAYQYFPVKTEVRLDFLTDERWLSIWGYVESNEVDIFSEQEKGLVSIVCPDPYFYEKDPISKVIGSAIPEFEFPFSNESLTEPLICFGDYSKDNIYEVEYNGDIEVGIVARIRFKKRPTVKKISLFNIFKNQQIDFDLEKITTIGSIYGITQYGEIVYSSVRGNKYINYELFSSKVSVLGAYNISDIDWFTLTPGTNVYGFTTDTGGNYDEFDIMIEHSGAYGGV